MLPSDLDVERAVRDFRAAIDAAGIAPWTQKGIRFPHGACGHAAELLGRYLIDELNVPAEYVCQDADGNLGGWQHAHTWLEWNGLTIDISGDQFGWEPVIVTRAPRYHGRGVDHTRHSVCLEHQRDWWAGECGSLWSAIKVHLPARPTK